MSHNSKATKTDSRRRRRTPNRKIESDAVNILEKHCDKNINSVEDRLWEPMPRALVIDSGAAETVMPSDWFPKHEVKEQRSVLHHG